MRPGYHAGYPTGYLPTTAAMASSSRLDAEEGGADDQDQPSTWLGRIGDGLFGWVDEAVDSWLEEEQPSTPRAAVADSLEPGSKEALVAAKIVEAATRNILLTYRRA